MFCVEFKFCRLFCVFPSLPVPQLIITPILTVSYSYFLSYYHKPCRVAQSVAQSVARLTQEPEVPGPIPDPATYVLSFLLPLIQEGQLSVTGESMCTKDWLTAKAV